jgi:hypothetical protein
LPAFLIGVGGGITEYLTLGASFSIPNSIRYNVFTRELKTGDYVDRYPEMYNYQGTATIAGHYNQYSAGINFINNRYSLRDLRVEDTFDKIMVDEDIIRIQPGFLYGGEKISLGLSYVFSVERQIKLGNIKPPYQIYDFKFPAIVDVATSYLVKDDLLVAGGLEYEQTSKQYSGFADRVKLKVGVEKRNRNYDLRGGLIHISSIYAGTFAIPSAHETPADYIYYPLPYDFGVVGKSDQLLLTGGFSYRFPKVELNGSIVKDILRNVDVFQFVVSARVKFSDIVALEAREK